MKKRIPYLLVTLALTYLLTSIPNLSARSSNDAKHNSKSTNTNSSSSSSTNNTGVMTQEEQAAMTPDKALQLLKEGNQRLIDGQNKRRDLHAQLQEAAKDQFPFAAILSCVDSRSGPELIFDQGIGDLFVARVAGNIAPAEVIASLQFAAHTNVKLILVLGHSDCGAVKAAISNTELGQLQTLTSEIQPAVKQVASKNPSQQPTETDANFVKEVAYQNVRDQVDKLKKSDVIAPLVQSKKLKIVGAYLDLPTGKVDFLEAN